jgi:putative transposase
VYATLLDEGTYLGSVSTMYRRLHAVGQVRERRTHSVHPASVKPELVAHAPNVVWSWDITKLHGPAKWTYFYLYVILDIYSRYVVGWMLAPHERATLAKVLIDDSISKHDIDYDRFTLHADRGSSMASPNRSPSCWPTSGSTRATPARTCPMTTRTPRPSSRP